jgi:SNF2 family DNA or RNA helicase
VFELRDYQVEGIEKLSTNNRFYLWDEPGMGKTVQLIRAADKVKAERALVACPANICIQWRTKVKELSEAGLHADVVSYNKLADNPAFYRKQKYGACFIDEGHYLKNRKAKRTQAVFGPRCEAVGGIIQDIEYVWDSTGSPAPNNYAELWSKLRAMTPEVITMKTGRIMDYWNFVDRFCIVKESGFGPQITGNKNTEILKERITPFMLRRLKKNYRNPPVIDTLTLQAKDSLKALREAEQSEEGQMIADMLHKHGVDGLSRITGHGAALRRLTGLAKVDLVVSQVIDEIEGGLQKLVMIAYHRDVIEGIQRGLEEAGIGCAVYYGGMTSQKQEAAKEAFIKNDKCRVFIGQITAAGTGTDGLQEVCGDIMLVEYSWVPEENKQIIGRLDRLGGWENVIARFVSLAGSLDEKISASVRRKTADIVALLG